MILRQDSCTCSADSFDAAGRGRKRKIGGAEGA
jgi:hypothetical protein